MAVGITVAPDTKSAQEEKRRKAFGDESDPFFLAAISYRAEGRLEDALSMEQAGVAKKAEIRARYPYPV